MAKVKHTGKRSQKKKKRTGDLQPPSSTKRGRKKRRQSIRLDPPTQDPTPATIVPQGRREFPLDNLRVDEDDGPATIDSLIKAMCGIPNQEFATSLLSFTRDDVVTTSGAMTIAVLVALMREFDKTNAYVREMMQDVKALARKAMTVTGSSSSSSMARGEDKGPRRGPAPKASEVRAQVADALASKDAFEGTGLFLLKPSDYLPLLTKAGRNVPPGWGAPLKEQVRALIKKHTRVLFNNNWAVDQFVKTWNFMVQCIDGPEPDEDNGEWDQEAEDKALDVIDTIRQEVNKVAGREDVHARALKVREFLLNGSKDAPHVFVRIMLWAHAELRGKRRSVRGGEGEGERPR